MNGLSLFSGAGIGELVFKQIIPNYRTIGYVEWDKYCQAVIRARIDDGVLDDAPIFGDIREFNARFASLYAGKVDFVSGGFPCTPYSNAGKRLGEASKDNMWPATFESISTLRPRCVLLENVPALLRYDYFQRIQGDLAEILYDCVGLPLSASDTGADHIREREWLLAYPISDRGPRLVAGGDLSHPRQRWPVGPKNMQRLADNPFEPTDMWPQPLLRRGVDGVAYRMDRLKAAGNGWVPRVVKAILGVSK